MRHRRPRALTLALILAVSLSGCGTSLEKARWGTDPRTGLPSEQINLRVRNRQFSQATLYLMSGGSRVRLGTVTAMANEVIRVPWGRYGPMQILIDLQAGPEFITPSVDVGPGDRVTLLIEEPLRASELRRE